MVKKLLIPIILSLFAAIAAVPLFVSYKAEQEYHQLIHFMKQGYANFTVQGEFHKGWLKSRAVTKLMPKVPMQGTGSENIFPIEFHHDITNGPVIFGNGHKLALAEVTTVLRGPLHTFLKAAFNNEEPVAIISDLKFNGSGASKITGPTMQMAIRESGNFNWGGVKGDIVHSQHFRNMDVNVLMPLLKFQEKENVLEMSQMKMQMDMSWNSVGLWMGSWQSVIDEISLMQNQTEIFSLKQAKFLSGVEQQNGLLNINVDTTLEQFSVPYGKYGPGSLMMAFNKLDVDVFKRLIELGEQAADPEQQSQAMQSAMMEMQELGVKFFRHSPEHKFDFKVLFPQGEVTLNANITVEGQQITDVTVLPDVVKAVKATIQARIPKPLFYVALAKHVEQQIEKEEMMKQFAIKKQNTMSKSQTSNVPESDQSSNAINSESIMEMSETAAEITPEPELPKLLTSSEKKYLRDRRMYDQLEAWKKMHFIIEEEETFYSEINYVNGVATINDHDMPALPIP